MGTREHNTLKQSGCTYYFTTTVLEWKHVFIKQSVISILINSILFFQNNRQVRTNGYCIMPNHLHWIFTLPEYMDDVVKIVQTFKSYTTTQTLKSFKSSTLDDKEPIEKIFDKNNSIKAETSSTLLETFYHLNPDKRSFHHFWQTDSDLKVVYSESFLHEKLDYIYFNPAQENWSIVRKPECYPFSSCRYYHKDNDWNEIDILSLF